MRSWDNANCELVFYYADFAGKPAAALEVASLEIARRRDVHTLDACAWALYVSGRETEAREHLEVAMAVGVRDSKILEHAKRLGGGRSQFHQASQHAGR